MIAYKLFRLRKDGSLGSLFINASARLPQGEWLQCDLHVKAGFKPRRGWHALAKPSAPHLSKSGRKWYRVSLKDWRRDLRPVHMGRVWYIAEQMKILGPV